MKTFKNLEKILIKQFATLCKAHSFLLGGQICMIDKTLFLANLLHINQVATLNLESGKNP